MVPQICYITVTFGTMNLWHFRYSWYHESVSLLLHLVHGPVTLLLHFVLWTCYITVIFCSLNLLLCYIRYFEPVTLGSLNLYSYNIFTFHTFFCMLSVLKTHSNMIIQTVCLKVNIFYSDVTIASLLKCNITAKIKTDGCDLCNESMLD